MDQLLRRKLNVYCSHTLKKIFPFLCFPFFSFYQNLCTNVYIQLYTNMYIGENYTSPEIPLFLTLSINYQIPSYSYYLQSIFHFFCLNFWDEELYTVWLVSLGFFSQHFSHFILRTAGYIMIDKEGVNFYMQLMTNIVQFIHSSYSLLTKNFKTVKQCCNKIVKEKWFYNTK